MVPKLVGGMDPCRIWPGCWLNILHEFHSLPAPVALGGGGLNGEDEDSKNKLVEKEDLMLPSGLGGSQRICTMIVAHICPEQTAPRGMRMTVAFSLDAGAGFFNNGPLFALFRSLVNTHASRANFSRPNPPNSPYKPKRTPFEKKCPASTVFPGTYNFKNR